MNFEYTFQITNSYMTVTRSLTNNTVPLNGAKLPPKTSRREFSAKHDVIFSPQFFRKKKELLINF